MEFYTFSNSYNHKLHVTSDVFVFICNLLIAALWNFTFLVNLTLQVKYAQFFFFLNAIYCLWLYRISFLMILILQITRTQCFFMHIFLCFMEFQIFNDSYTTNYIHPQIFF